jgi:hypothetical protein
MHLVGADLGEVPVEDGDALGAPSGGDVRTRLPPDAEVVSGQRPTGSMAVGGQPTHPAEMQRIADPSDERISDEADAQVIGHRVIVGGPTPGSGRDAVSGAPDLGDGDAPHLHRGRACPLVPAGVGVAGQAHEFGGDHLLRDAEPVLEPAAHALLAAVGEAVPVMVGLLLVGTQRHGICLGTG